MTIIFTHILFTQLYIKIYNSYHKLNLRYQSDKPNLNAIDVRYNIILCTKFEVHLGRIIHIHLLIITIIIQPSCNYLGCNGKTPVL